MQQGLADGLAPKDGASFGERLAGALKTGVADPAALRALLRKLAASLGPADV